jgi:hypothetical protein
LNGWVRPQEGQRPAVLTSGTECQLLGLGTICNVVGKEEYPPGSFAPGSEGGAVEGGMLRDAIADAVLADAEALACSGNDGGSEAKGAEVGQARIAPASRWKWKSRSKSVDRPRVG